MTLKELLDTIDAERSGDALIQICREGWNAYDGIAISSPFLEFVENRIVTDIGAIASEVYRVKLGGWGE